MRHYPSVRSFVARSVLANLAIFGAIGLGAAPAAGADGCDTAGLELPAGFCATRFAQLDDGPRHIAVSASGVVYANLGQGSPGHALMALRDSNGDGKADRRTTFGNGGATGLTIHNGWLYSATLTDIYRYRLGRNLRPVDAGQHLISGLPQQNEHTARGLAVDDNDHLFVSIGAPSNACQRQDRAPGSKGRDPCPLLREHGGIWRFSASRTGQHFSPEARYATGVRNLFALTYNAARQQLYGAQMGRDQLYSNWPDTFTQRQSAHLPAEVLFAVDQGDNFGWPYCYYDPQKKQNLLNPEYGGNGKKVGRCSRYEPPVAAYPAHWAPMATMFYTGQQFPKPYRGGAFIAFHGSWNRAPEPQSGYRVIYQPFNGNKASARYATFAGAQGFTDHKVVRSPGEADHRPAGLAQGPKGALYISDDQGGTIYRVTYGK